MARRQRGDKAEAARLSGKLVLLPIRESRQCFLYRCPYDPRVSSLRRAQRMPSRDLFLRRPLSKAGTFICLQIGIWQGCQISRLFHEDAQGAQVIDLSILPR